MKTKKTTKKYNNYLLFFNHKIYTSFRDAAKDLKVNYTTLKNYVDRNMEDNMTSYSFVKYGHSITVKINNN